MGWLLPLYCCSVRLRNKYNGAWGWLLPLSFTVALCAYVINIIEHGMVVVQELLVRLPINSERVYFKIIKNLSAKVGKGNGEGRMGKFIHVRATDELISSSNVCHQQIF